MRIALVILHADPARGGAERYTIDLFEGLRKRGHEVALVASTVAGEGDGRVKVPAHGATRVGRYLSFLDALDRHLEEGRYAVVHAMLPVRRCDVYHPHAGIAAEAVSGSNRLKLLANPRRIAFANVERELLNGPKPPVVLCLSEYVKRTVVEHYPLSADRLVTLFNAIDLEKFDPAARPDAGLAVRQRFGIGSEKIVALIIAQDFARKGLREAIVAMSQTRDERLVLLVVGKEDPAPYRRVAEDNGVARQVIFAGATTDPYSFYRAADFFLLPTRHDPCSLVVLEALAMGLPVISTVFNGACELMQDAKHGFVLREQEDVESLALAMRALLDDTRRREMRHACVALRPTLAFEHHLDRLIEVYERGGGPRPFAQSGW